MEYSDTFYDGFCAGLEFARLRSRKGKTVAYARWLPLHSNEFPKGAECSNCGSPCVEAVQTPVNYMPICPNCGAKMTVYLMDW